MRCSAQSGCSGRFVPKPVIQNLDIQQFQRPLYLKSGHSDIGGHNTRKRRIQERSSIGLLVAPLLLTLAIGCGPMNPPGRDQHIEQLRLLDEAWKAAAAQRDLEGMMAIYAPDAQELLPDMLPIVGRDAIREFYRGLIEAFPRFAHQFDANEFIVAESGDLAVVRGSYRFTADTRRPAEVQSGKFVGIWRRRDENWRLQMNISNSDQP